MRPARLQRSRDAKGIIEVSSRALGSGGSGCRRARCRCGSPPGRAGAERRVGNASGASLFMRHETLMLMRMLCVFQTSSSSLLPAPAGSERQAWRAVPLTVPQNMRTNRPAVAYTQGQRLAAPGIQPATPPLPVSQAPVRKCCMTVRTLSLTLLAMLAFAGNSLLCRLVLRAPRSTRQASSLRRHRCLFHKLLSGNAA